MTSPVLKQTEKEGLHMTRLTDGPVQQTLLAALCALILTVGCDGSSHPPPESLTINITGSSRAMYPEFEPTTHHYAVGCGSQEDLLLKVEKPGADITVNGGNPVTGDVEMQLIGLGGDDEIIIDVDYSWASNRYVIHCLPDDFPQIEIVHTTDQVSDGLIWATPKFREDGEMRAYLTVLDNNGVPRFHRKVNGSASDFKRQKDGHYSYLMGIGKNSFGLNDSVAVLLDESFSELTTLTTVGLTQTDGHDFLVTEEGNYLFISYNSTPRDMSLFGFASDQISGDSIIQEVTPEGNVVFEWNSWDHIDISDCRAAGHPAFPGDYAHLNSIQLTPEGDIIGSFRGCAQVLKIDRPSGDVIWQLGGTASDFTIVGDPYEEFCGQHTALELEDNHIIMFDNGNYCIGDRESVYGQFSRVLMYQLDLAAGEAIFSQHQALNGTFQEFTRSQGAVQVLENGNWLISWGSGPDMSITELDSSGEEVFAMKIVNNGDIAVTYRAFRYPDLTLPVEFFPKD